MLQECATQTREVPEEQCATTVEQECTNTVKQVIILGNLKYEHREIYITLMLGSRAEVPHRAR